ncbi:unnamed protein product [Rotaria socialis]|uniref:Serine-type D-Ala-D-Ala carboxypeptidase n=1 Tax=Rotaria socialis TaxID=392032 RepID=A0A820Z271_9BILA|nr:unnamed protein product [Rotaria socialis]CAF4555025.1 unnamed protein product [Rotaria socialis]CAF4752388.1 unnamed protein product [Rotaria socialis]
MLKLIVRNSHLAEYNLLEKQCFPEKLPSKLNKYALFPSYFQIQFVLHLFGWSSVIIMDRIGNFSAAWQKFIQDPHVAHAVYSMTVLDGRTGSILFEHAKDIGLPPASSLKTITAAAALHYLGTNYTYETLLQYSGEIDTVTGSGDPSLGSWRYDESIAANTIIKKWIETIRKAGISKCRGIIGDTSRWNNTKTMFIDGWTWNDIGHWYGAGHSALNWRENEFTIEIQSGSSNNTSAHIIVIKNSPPGLKIINELTTSSLEGEVSLYFSVDGSNVGYLRGTVPLDASPNFDVHCAVPDPALYAAHELTQALRINGVDVEQEATVGSNESKKLTLLDIHRSPPLSKLIEQFLRVSINMYGEVFVKTIAHRTGKSSLFDAPLKILPSYIHTLLDIENSLDGIAITDGSGLSRSNRLSTYALARILFTVQKQPWFDNVYYEAFPTINGLRMKSGTLMNTIAYAGYIKEHSFVFSFMINNYHGETAPNMRKKIWNILDALK